MSQEQADHQEGQMRRVDAVEAEDVDAAQGAGDAEKVGRVDGEHDRARDNLRWKKRRLTIGRRCPCIMHGYDTMWCLAGLCSHPKTYLRTGSISQHSVTVGARMFSF